jgi:carboxyl-terminal processing protease
VRAAGIALLVCAAVLASACPATASPGFDTRLTSRVFSAALTFTTPRLLDAATPAELTLWGLHGITTLDPALTTELVGNQVRLSAPDRILFIRPTPPADDAKAWGDLAAEVNAAAFDASATLRHAGNQVMVQTFFDDMFAHSDPYSRYVPPAPAEVERDKLSVDAGAGLGLVRQHGGVVVSDVVPGGPGAAAGVRVGDRILTVDSERVRGANVAQARGLLTGPDGTELAVRVRGMDGQERRLNLILAFVPPETVFSARDNGLLVLRITAFDGNTAERLSQALEAGVANKPAPAALVIDLRGNRGGLLRQAVTSVALLAEQGIIASTTGRDPQATHDWRIDGGDLTHGLPVIVLVDGRSASAAEIMAAALADLGRAVVVGSATLGKGLVQTITRLPDGGELFVTWSRVLAPRGWPIQSLGVMPQVCTGLGPQKMAAALGDLADGRQDMEAALAASRAARPPLSVEKALEIRAACPASEGGDGDMAAAAFLAAHPGAYKAALLPVQ